VQLEGKRVAGVGERLWALLEWVIWNLLEWVMWTVLEWVLWTVLEWVLWTVLEWVLWTVLEWVKRLVVSNGQNFGVFLTSTKITGFSNILCCME
jgi:hypothetical protein